MDFYTCKNDGTVFVISPIRRANVTPRPEAEETKYRTPQGVAIGTDEGELQRLLGRAERTGEWSERHGQLEVLVRQYVYPGLRILVNRSDSKAFAVGATTPGEFVACRDAVFGWVPVTVSLPVPLPANLRIQRPGADVPANRAAFSGVWVGKWDNALDTALTVAEFTPLGVTAVYSWGVAPQWRINSPGWTNVRGRFAGPDELHIQVGQVLAAYRMRSDGRLDAEFAYGRGGPRTTMTKVFSP
ncbi:MAG: hypothetical protein QN131_09170 [Armatimonadota bacterium]|nr:hypothetical protein [Armatimonadota bacterium]